MDAEASSSIYLDELDKKREARGAQVLQVRRRRHHPSEKPHGRQEGDEVGGLIHRIRMRDRCQAYRDGEMKVVVLYSAASVRRSKCPEAVAYIGTHIPMEYKGQDGKTYWNYQEIKKAIMG